MNQVWKTFGDKESHPMYKGEIKNGKPHGMGITLYPDEGNYDKWYNGGKYVGEWKNGFFDGHGTFYAHLGWKYVGG